MQFPHRVTIIEPGATTDRYNDAAANWSDDAVTRTEDVPAWMQQGGNPPGASAEQVTAHRSRTLVFWTCFLPADVAISSLARIEWGDDTFDVDGDPQAAPTPHGVHHLEVSLRLVRG